MRDLQETLRAYQIPSSEPSGPDQQAEAARQLIPQALRQAEEAEAALQEPGAGALASVDSEDPASTGLLPRAMEELLRGPREQENAEAMDAAASRPEERVQDEVDAGTRAALDSQAEAASGEATRLESAAWVGEPEAAEGTDGAGAEEGDSHPAEREPGPETVPTEWGGSETAGGETGHGEPALENQGAQEVDAGQQQEGFAAWLDKAIDATKPGTGWTAETSMGLFRVPVWLSKELAHGTLLAVRAAMRAGQRLGDAIETGIEWLRDRNPRGFDENEARDWLRRQAQSQRRIEKIKAELFGAQKGPGNRIQKVNGRNPINSRYAGQPYPLAKLPRYLQKKYPKGVRFKPTGFPNYSPYAVAEARVKGLTGNYKHDAALANEKARLTKTPPDYIWHHVEDEITMQLVPWDLHDFLRHTGGAARLKGRASARLLRQSGSKPQKARPTQPPSPGPKRLSGKPDPTQSKSN